MQRLIAACTSRYVCTLICLIAIIWVAATLPANGQASQIPLDASMIIIVPGVGSDDEAELVDEQASFPDGACYTSWENWGNPTYPQSIYLDLGQEYVIEEVHLFNHCGDHGVWAGARLE